MDAPSTIYATRRRAANWRSQCLTWFQLAKVWLTGFKPVNARSSGFDSKRAYAKGSSAENVEFIGTAA
jgi:hypothetical protein